MTDKHTKRLIREIYGKPDMKVRFQLYGLMKKDPDFQSQLSKMKKLFKSMK